MCSVSSEYQSSMEYIQVFEKYWSAERYSDARPNHVVHTLDLTVDHIYVLKNWGEPRENTTEKDTTQWFFS